MYGQLPPCVACQTTMNHVDAESSARFTYRQAGNQVGLFESEPVVSNRRGVTNLLHSPPSDQAAEPTGGPLMVGAGLLLKSFSDWWNGVEAPPPEEIPVPLPDGPTVRNPR